MNKKDKKPVFLRIVQMMEEGRFATREVERIAFLERLREPLRKVSPLNSAIIQSWDDFDVLVGRRLRDLAR